MELNNNEFLKRIIIGIDLSVLREAEGSKNGRPPSPKNEWIVDTYIF